MNVELLGCWGPLELLRATARATARAGRIAQPMPVFVFALQERFGKTQSGSRTGSDHS